MRKRSVLPVIDGQRVCTKCLLPKPFTNEFFPQDRVGVNGLGARCKQCLSENSKKWREANPEKYTAGVKKWALEHPEKRKEIANRYAQKPSTKQKLRNLWLTRAYNLDEQKFNEILSSQEGKCKICKKFLKSPNWHIDHDHNCCSGSTSCGKCIRGILCNGCNWGLGNFWDNARSLLSAIIYLAEGSVA